MIQNNIEERLRVLKQGLFTKSELKELGLEYWHPLSDFYLFADKNNNLGGEKNFYLFKKEKDNGGTANGKEYYSFLFSR